MAVCIKLSRNAALQLLLPYDYHAVLPLFDKQIYFSFDYNCSHCAYFNFHKHFGAICTYQDSYIGKTIKILNLNNSLISAGYQVPVNFRPTGICVGEESPRLWISTHERSHRHTDTHVCGRAATDTWRAGSEETKAHYTSTLRGIHSCHPRVSCAVRVCVCPTSCSSQCVPATYIHTH